MTLLQIAAIINLLLAFGVSQSAVDKVQSILNAAPSVIVATTTASVIITNPPSNTETTPVFGAVILPSAPLPVSTLEPTYIPPASVVVPPIPQPRLEVKAWVTDAPRGVNIESATLTVRANDENNSLHFEVTTFDKDGKYSKMPVTVATNSPDLPPSFVINDVGVIPSVQVCKGWNVKNGAACEMDAPSTKGTFDIIFTVPDTTISQTFTFSVI